MKFRAFAATLFLFSCASQPASEGTGPSAKPASTVTAFSHLGNDFTVDVISRTIIRPKEASLDVSSWGVDAAFRDGIAESARAHGQGFRALTLDPKALERALNARESRWKKFVGRHNQALLDFLLARAGEQGLDVLVLVSPKEARDSYPLHKGNMGIYCYDRKLLKSRAYAYFFAEVTAWDVKAKKKLFQRAVDPSATQEMAFAECREVADLKEPLASLKEPVAHTIQLLARKVFPELAAKMGWEKTPE